MLKIIVYAISKNEEKFAERWMRSMGEADGVYVLDTGSSDNTVKVLRECGAVVNQREISPWRFDKARNLSLGFVPKDADICVCTDLDEVFEPGWRKLLEESWTKETDCATYRYTWNFNEDGSEGYVFWIEKIHSRANFVWEHPVHEVLKFTNKKRRKRCVCVSGMQLNHYADTGKARSSYLPLLELSVKESPDDDRNMHYLGREYMYYQRWDECIQTLTKHLQMPSATWKDERAASMRYIAKAYCKLGLISQAYDWHFKSIAEAPYLREPYCDFALSLYAQGDFDGVLFMCKRALNITARSMSYINEADAWGVLPYDLSAIASYKTGRFKDALMYSDKAVKLAPQNKRLLDNHKLYQEKATF